MATALKLKNDINKLKAALRSKATPKSFIPKLKSQLEKAEADYESVKAGKKSAPKAGKQVKSTMDKLKAIIKKKKYGAYRAQGVDLKKDADRPALPTGKRISKNGNTYYEYRANRIDVKQPPKRYPKLEKGGYMEDGGKMPNNYEGKTPKEIWDNWTYEQKFHFLTDHKDHKSNPLEMNRFKLSDVADKSSYDELPKNIKLALSDHISEGQYAKGGKTKKVTTPEEYYEKKERAFQNALKNLDSFDFEMFSEEGNDAVRKEVQKAFDKIDDLEKKPSKDWALRLKRQIISNVEDDFQEVDDTEPGTNISVLLDYKLKQKGYDFGDDYWDYLYYKYAKGGYMADGGEMSSKNYKVQYNVGKSKYVINYHDGEKKHKDGSPFYDVAIFKNMKDFMAYKKKLKSEGYKEMAKGGMADGGVIYLESVGTYFRPSDLATSVDGKFEDESEIFYLNEIDNYEWWRALSKEDKKTIEKDFDVDKLLLKEFDTTDLDAYNKESVEFIEKNKKAKGAYMADGGMTPLDVSNQIYDITVRIAELGNINTEAAYEETKNLMKMRAALQARALHLQDMEMAKGGYMAKGGKLEVGDEGMYEGGEAVILTIDDKSYGYSYLDEDGKPKSQKMFAAKSKFENQFRVFPKYAGGGELHRSQEKYAYGRYMAMGGAIEHGLKKGDHIMVVRGNMLGIKNEITGEIVTLNIETGERKESKE